MRISLFQLLLIVILFLVFFQSKFNNLSDYFKSSYQFFEKKDKISSTKKKIDS